MTHQSPQQQRIFNLLQRADKLIGAMMPGVRYIALQDYAELNNVPCDIAGMLKELSDPATTDWTQERIHAPNNSIAFISAARHLVAMVDETQRYDMDMVCGHELKEANNNVRRLLPYEQAICAPADCAATIKVTI